jgi:hypothetical protein
MTLLLPVILPIIRIPIFVGNTGPAALVDPINNISIPEHVFETAVSTPVNSFNYARLIIWIYFTIAVILLLRIVASLISTYRIINIGTIQSNQFPKIIISDLQLPPFSFFPYAVSS